MGGKSGGEEGRVMTLRLSSGGIPGKKTTKPAAPSVALVPAERARGVLRHHVILDLDLYGRMSDPVAFADDAAHGGQASSGVRAPTQDDVAAERRHARRDRPDVKVVY